MTALESYEAVSPADRNICYPIIVLADAAIESLKCCGNCGHWDVHHNRCGARYDDEVNEVPTGFFGSHRCHFTPSRWAERC